MTMQTFNEEEIKILSKNPYVKSAGIRQLEFTEEFHQLLAFELHCGVKRETAFEKFGLDPLMIGKHRINNRSSVSTQRYGKNYFINLIKNSNTHGEVGAKSIARNISANTDRTKAQLVAENNQLAEQLKVYELYFELEESRFQALKNVIRSRR